MSDYRLPFRPVRGNEADILASQPIEGYLYFALDTKKIFYGDGKGESAQFLKMGSASSFYYGKMITANNPDKEQTTFTFGLDDIEGNDSIGGSLVVPEIDSLILNIPDGCFYRVKAYGENEFHNITLITQKLTIAGSGSGTGPAGGGAEITRAGSDTLECVYGESCNIKYKFKAFDSAGDPTGSATATWYVDGVKKATSVAYQNDIVNTFDIGPYLHNGNNTVVVSIAANIGGLTEYPVTKNWKVNAVDLKLEWDYDNTIINKTDEEFELTWKAYGGVEKDTYIIFDDSDIHKVTSSANQSGMQQTQKFTGLSHGSHKVEMYVQAQVGENSDNVRTPSIIKELLFLDEKLPSPEPIIACSLNTYEMMQYDTLKIPIVIYDKQSSNGYLNVVFYENDIPVEEWKDSDEQPHENGKLYYWNYTPMNSGSVKLSIVCRGVKKNLNIIVNTVDLGNVSEIAGYDFKLKASDFAGNNALRSWNNNGIDLSFSENFDWVNGGLQTETDEKGEIKTFINVRNGTRMTINFNLFADDCLGKNKQGKAFKFIFKASGCRTYDAEVLSCYANGIGLRMNAQNATLTSMIMKDNSALNIPYCEDTYIEFEVDAWPYDESYVTIKGERVDTGKRYLMAWLDGVPAAMKVYDTNDSLTQSSPVAITIGSDDCDVQVYLVKSYSMHLTDEGHLNNFIMDAPNATEMMRRFKRNDILENGQISYKKLVEANKGLKAHLYDMSRMTTSKNDPVEGCSYALYENSSEAPVVQSTDVSVKVQGTSSAKYGTAAYNLDSDFSAKGFTYADGSHSDKYAMTENSIPVDFFCTKVNVASCEGANNALNQEWYNNYQPWISGVRKKNKKARDCMEFHPGVVFVLDRNTNTSDEQYSARNVFADTPGYVNNPYYKLYSIGCMGNSKDNIEVFHDLTNPLECCVEVDDNQLSQQWMTRYSLSDPSNPDSIVLFKEGDSKYYSFRYPEDATSQHKESWSRFVKWMCHNDPSPYDIKNHPYGYTGNKLDEPKTFGEFTFSGKDGSTILKGLTITDYAGTYEYDTYEYRMAKMLSECEDYLIMDPTVYHYVFIERHTMVDNVAKNTFWSTEDGIHWCLNKNYDNDTADGNDNQGGLSLTYGIECMDNENDTYYFNAHHAVWFNFIHGLFEARALMFRNRENKGAWESELYLNAFDEWQNKIPERVWIEDYYRKYRRPRELGLDSSNFYTNMLAGGKKTHQRKQFETYQETYMSSQYLGSVCTTSAITFRGSGELTKDKNLMVSMYTDCYIHADIGSTKSVPIRAKRGVKYPLVFNGVTDLGNTTNYFYLSNMIQSIDNIYLISPTHMEFSSALRLRSINVNDKETGSINYGLQNLGFGSNPMLEYISAQNCPNTSSSLDLRGLKNLRELNIEGSGFTSVSFADGAVITKLKLNDKLTSLEAKNLINLEEFTLEGYQNLEQIKIDNCNIDTYDLIKKCMQYKDDKDTVLKYNLIGVKWKTSDPNDLDNNTKALKVLDYLASEKYTSPLNSKSLSLTGLYEIETQAYNGAEGSDFYTKYINTSMFPNLDLDFKSENSVMYKVEIVDAGNTVVWTKKIKKGEGITSGFLSDGPNGKFTTFTSYQDNQYIYTFNNSWTIKNAKTSAIEKIIDGDYPYWEGPVNSNIIIIPNFDKTVRTFTVTFKNGNEIIHSGTYPYGYKIANIVPAVLPSKDDSDLIMTRTYKFTGYAIGNNSIPVTNAQMEILELKDDMEFSACFDSIEVYDNVLDNKYLRFEETIENGVVGYSVSANPSYSISGKITLPTTYSGKPIIKIKKEGFSNKGNILNKITHVFWAKENRQLKNIGDSAFFVNDGFDPYLKYFEFPDTVIIIEQKAFQGQELLECSVLPRDLITINQYAFQGCESTTITTIGGQVETIGSSAFSGALGSFKTLTIGDSVKNIGSAAFGYYEYSKPEKLEEVIIGSGIETIASDAFIARNNTNSSINTIRKIAINKPTDSVLNAPWGATLAQIDWQG